MTARLNFEEITTYFGLPPALEIMYSARMLSGMSLAFMAFSLAMRATQVL